MNRLLSLDALRGFTIAGMIMVNNPGTWEHVYAPLRHASWHGFTPTDLVFPFFLFIVGVSIALSFTKQRDSGASPSQMHRKILIRALKIFAVGVFLNLWPSFDFENIRIAGVLQRIALVFAACAWLFVNTNWKQQVYTTLAIVLGYWALMAWVPVPVDATIEGALASGEIQRSGSRIERVDVQLFGDASIVANYQPGTNLAAWADRVILPGRMYEKTWDPEGFLSTLPSIATALLGLLAGQLLLRRDDIYRKTTWIFAAGFVAFCLGYAISWGFPLNKNLWSSSFALLTGGLGMLCLAICMLATEGLGYKGWTFVGRVFGANAIVSYALAGMLSFLFSRPYFGGASLKAWHMNIWTGLGLSPTLASLTYALCYVAFIFIPAYLLYRKKIFIRL